MKKEILDFIQDNKQEVLMLWIEHMKIRVEEDEMNFHSNEIFVTTGQEYVNLLIINTLGENGVFDEKLIDLIEKAVKNNWSLSFLVKGLQSFERIILDGLEKEELFVGVNHWELVRDFHEWIHPLYNKIVRTYSAIWEKTVSLQKMALQELSAPLIPVFDGVTVMPLVGTIDTERAKQVMENLLNGVVKHRSEVVLIDITGVPIVDTMVAHHIIQAIDAVRLIGAKSFLVGIRPEIAQTMVNLGVDLDKVETKNTLKKGIESALEITNKKMVDIGGAQ